MSLSSRNIVCILAIAQFILAGACTNSAKQAPKKGESNLEVPVTDTLLISTDNGNLEQMNGNASTTDFVILQEDDNTMFADIGQVIDAFDKYFIVDTYGSRRVVSFDHNGKPLASYGKHGNGPGEYIYPWDVDVSAEYVYILDISQRKLLKYNHEGDYIDSQTVPFDSKGFTLLNDNKILFSLDPSKDIHYQLCVTDSALNPLNYMLCYPDGYVGGWVTNDMFLKNKKGISYYASPADTIYRLDYDGNLTGKRLLTFKNGAIDASAKLDFIEAKQQGKLTSGTHLLNNPFELPDGTCFMEITDYSNRETYVVTLNPANGMHRAKKFADNMSIYDVIVPCASNGDNQIISYLDREIAEKCDDFNRMPDSLVEALNKGNRLLVIHKMN